MLRRAVLLTSLFALVVAAPAAASGTLTVKKVDTSGFPTVRVTVQTGVAGQAPDLQITENGAPARNLTPVDPGAPAAIALVIDTSNSMSGQKLQDAINAASGFVSTQKDGNLLAVYGFDSQPYPAARLSPDKTEIVTAISQLGTGGQSGTALYGAVKMAASDLHTAPAQRRIMILLTDGASQSDTATLDDALKAAEEAGVDVYPIGIATTGNAQAVLDQIAKATAVPARSPPTRRRWPASTTPSPRSWARRTRTSTRARSRPERRSSSRSRPRASTRWSRRSRRRDSWLRRAATAADSSFPRAPSDAWCWRRRSVCSCCWRWH